MPLLSVIIPVYNEVNTIREVIDKVNAVDIDDELIVVDDASTDGTSEVLREIEGGKIKIVYHAENRGKGAAFLAGLAHATGEFAIPQDADLESDPRDIATLLEYAVKNDLPAVFGSRFLRTWRVTSWWHYLVNRFLTGWANILFGASLTDMNTCYKLIKSSVIKELELKAQKFDIDPEMTGKLLKKGYRIKEIPISYKGRFYHQGKKIGWQDGISSIICLLKVRLF